MPSAVNILCQIRSKGQDGGFINGLAAYTTELNENKNFHYGFYKKQISEFLYDFKVGDYVLLCGKCVFNRGILYVCINRLYKIMYFIFLYINKKKLICYYRYY